MAAIFKSSLQNLSPLPTSLKADPVGKLTSFRHQNDNGPDVNKLSFFYLV